jgi:WhiB family redox-sensing transcriptional regulator
MITDQDGAVRGTAKRLDPGDKSWFEAAACRDGDQRLFFDPEGEGAKPRAARERAAKAVCAWCPVRRECLIFALWAPERYGIWGGLTARERTSLRRRRLPARRGNPHQELHRATSVAMRSDDR